MLYNIIYVYINIYVDMFGGKKILFCKIEFLDKYNIDWLKAISIVRLLCMYDIYVYIIGYFVWEFYLFFLYDV